MRPTPAELGLTGWTEYTPIRPPELVALRTPENRRNAFVFTALYRSRATLPAELSAHRAGKLVLGGLQPDTVVLVDGDVALTQTDAASDTAMVQVQAGRRRGTVR